MRWPLRPSGWVRQWPAALAQPGLGVDGGDAVGRNALGLLEGPDGGLGAPPEVAVGGEAVAELLTSWPCRACTRGPWKPICSGPLGGSSTYRLSRPSGTSSWPPVAWWG